MELLKTSLDLEHLDENVFYSPDKMRELILAIKDKRIERGWSVNHTFEEIKAAGYPTSRTSVQRLFDDGSENKRFRYEDTVKPALRVLYDMDKPIPERIAGDEDQAEAFREQAAIFKDVNTIKNDQLVYALKEIDTLTDRLAYTRKERDETVSFLRRHYARISAALVICAILLVITIVFLIVLLIYDLTHLDRGWIQQVLNSFSSNGSGLGMML